MRIERARLLYSTSTHTGLHRTRDARAVSCPRVPPAPGSRLAAPLVYTEQTEAAVSSLSRRHGAWQMYRVRSGGARGTRYARRAREHTRSCMLALQRRVVRGYAQIGTQMPLSFLQPRVTSLDGAQPKLALWHAGAGASAPAKASQICAARNSDEYREREREKHGQQRRV